MAAIPPIINVMIRAAEAGSKTLTRDFGEVEHLQVAERSPASFVSAACTRAEDIIQRSLEKDRPAYSLLMKESGYTAGSDESKVWHIDPLNGRDNFIHGIPHWCVSIALEEDGEITAGVIFDPVKDELFWAATGQGAFMRGHRRMRVSERKDVKMALFASGPYRIGKDMTSNAEKLNVFLRQSMGVRKTGSTALDLAYVAAGRYDAFWGTGYSSWNVAAAYIMIKEAGGMASSLLKKKEAFSGDAILASSSSFHNEFMSFLEIKSKKEE